MSAQLGNLVVNLEANIAEFNRNMERASQQTEQAMNRMQAASDKVKNVLNLIGGALTVDLIVGEVNKTISALADLDDMAQKTGASVENLSKLSKVAMATGVDFGTVDGAIVKLSKNLAAVDEEGNKTAKALAAIGIANDDLRNSDPAELFVEIANKLQNYQDGAGKVALATDLMGKSAADLLPYMNDVSESFDKFEGDSAEAAAAAAKFQDDLSAVRVKYEELKTSILNDALPAMTAFMTAVMDTKRETGLLAKDKSMLTWADDVAIVLARVVDRAKLAAGAFGVVASGARVAAAEARVVAALNPVVMAYTKLEGGDPMAEYQKAAAASDKALAEASAKIDAFNKLSATATEEATIRSIAARKSEAGMAALAGMVGADGIGADRPTLNWTGAEGKDPKKKPEKEWSSADAAARIGALGTNEAIGIRATIDATSELMEADQRRFEAKMQADAQIIAGVQNIRMSMMSDAELESMEHETRLGELRAYRARELTDTMEADALIEQETARHKQAIDEIERRSAEQRMALNMEVMQQAGGVADQMYDMLKRAGLEQTALGKAAFLASKALAVAQIIMSTNVAAASAMAPPPLGLGPVAGIGLAGTIKALGYSSAAMTAGLAIAEASAEGGYDIPEGVNPVVQTHAKEMILPRAQADVIRDLATNGGPRAGGVTIHSSPQIHIDSRTDQGEVQKLVYTAVRNGNADLVDQLQRAGRI